MMAAAQPFIAAPSPRPSTCRPAPPSSDCEAAYLEGWRLGLKALALYRDGSKLAQPLASMLPTDIDDDEEDATELPQVQQVVEVTERDRRALDPRAAQAAEPAQGLHPEGGGRRPQGLSAHRRVRGRHARRDLRRHAQGRCRLPLADEQLRDRDLDRPAVRRAARGVRRGVLLHPLRSVGRRCRATTRSRWRPRCSTTSSASSRSPIWSRTDLAQCRARRCSSRRPGQGHCRGRHGRRRRYGSSPRPASSAAIFVCSRAAARSPIPTTMTRSGSSGGSATIGVGAAGGRHEQPRGAGADGPAQGLCRRSLLCLRQLHAGAEWHLPEMRYLRLDHRL